jgi:hypothetical protein
LARFNVLPGFSNSEPGAAVYFGNFDPPTGTWRPFDLTAITDQFFWIAVALKSPGEDHFPPSLFDPAEIEETVGRDKTGLLIELAFGSLHGLLSVQIFSFRDCPRSQVFLCEEWSSWMNKEDLQIARSATIHHQTRTAPLHLRNPGQLLLSPKPILLVRAMLMSALLEEAMRQRGYLLVTRHTLFL